MIGELLNLKGESIVDVFFNAKTPELSEAAYKEITTRISDAYYPVLTGHLEKEQVVKRADDCKTIEELEAMKYSIIPDTFFADIAEKVNAEESLNDGQRVFLLAQLSDRIVFSAKQWTNTVMHQRAQRIASQKKIII